MSIFDLLDEPEIEYGLAYESIYYYLPGGIYHSPMIAFKEDHLFASIERLLVEDVFNFERDGEESLFLNYSARDTVDTGAMFDGGEETFSFHVCQDIEAGVRLMMDFTGIERSGQAHVEEAMVFENVPYNQAFRELQTVNWFGVRGSSYYHYTRNSIRDACAL